MAEEENNRKLLSAGEKIILQRNVEFIEFVETEDKLRPFQCRHCGQVAIFHVQLQCGHILCQECFPILHLKRCPANDCKECVEHTVFDMNCLDHEISELKAFCKYNKRGCDAIVSLGDLLSHQRNCPFSKLTNEEIEELTKCKEEIRILKKQFAEFQVQFQPLIPLIKEKCLIQNKDIEDFVLEKVKMDSEKQRMKLEKHLTGNLEKYIDNKLEIERNKTETKLLLKYEKDFQNLQEKLLKEMNENRDMIEMSVKNETTKKLKSEVKNLKQDLQKDLLTQNEDLKKKLQETSKAFIEGVVEVKSEEIAKQSFNQLRAECKKYLQEIKKDLSHEIELKLSKNVENQRTILFHEMKSEVNVKGEEIKLIAIQKLNEEFRKELHNAMCNLERSFNENYELDKLKMEDNLKKQISTEIHCDINSLIKRLDVLSPRSFNVIWEFEDFINQLSNNELSIESEVFHLYEIECKVKFIFHPHYMYFRVKYVDQPNDEAFPFNGHHRITFIMHDQVDNKSQNDFIRIFEPTFGDWTNGTLSPCYWVPNDDLSFLHSRWLKNGKLQVKVIVEPLNHIMAFEQRHHGHLIWKIDHFKDVCESYKYGRQCSLSEAFHSSEKGYRMKGFLFIDDAVDFRLYFLKGPWDKDLSKEFKHRTMVTLISQKDPSELKDKTISLESGSTTCDYINDFPKADLEKYVKNDSLIICFKVESL